MKRTVPLTVALLISALIGLACVVEDPNALTAIGTPTPPSRPNVPVNPNATPVPPPPPVVPAAGTYFGRIVGIDPNGAFITFEAVCVGADRGSLRELSAQNKAPRDIAIAPTTVFSIFTSPPNNPAAGRLSPVDLPALAEHLRTRASNWWLMVDPTAVIALEQDSGVRTSPQPDDPCPH